MACLTILSNGERIADYRTHALYKFSIVPVYRFKVIYLEHLNVRCMVKNYGCTHALYDTAMDNGVGRLIEENAAHGDGRADCDRAWKWCQS